MSGWKAIYWRYHSKQEHGAETEEDAVRFLMTGEDYGDLSSDSVLDPEGNVVWTSEELSNLYVYGHREGKEGREQGRAGGTDG